MQLDKLTNQVRFIQMIIKKELLVSGRKKQDIVRDLKTKGFTTFAKEGKAAGITEVEAEENAAEEDEDNSVVPGDAGYDYLLNVRFCQWPNWS